MAINKGVKGGSDLTAFFDTLIFILVPFVAFLLLGFFYLCC